MKIAQYSPANFEKKKLKKSRFLFLSELDPSHFN